MRQAGTFSQANGIVIRNPLSIGSSKPNSGTKNGAASNVRKQPISRQAIVGLLLILALIAFEIFNFDTTRFALFSFLGDASFILFRWATILAVAFCAIDFAGLAYLFSPDRKKEESQEAWYLMGAWLLGATMNALMTWWTVSLILLDRDFGNELIGRSHLLHFVPILVAVLVWITRILFIGAFSVAGDRLFWPANQHKQSSSSKKPQTAADRNRGTERLEVPNSSGGTNKSGSSSSHTNSNRNRRPHQNRRRPIRPGLRPVAPAAVSARARRR
jgi:hypothetical protein